jgi:5'-nucleotidase
VKVLISNDDGINALGLTTLATSLRRDHTVFIVAPAHEQSASSHSLTLRHPLSVEKVGEDSFAVDGTPADCVNLAVNGILKTRPDLVVSGINHGANLGDDVFYSGTVSAAVEAMLLDIPSVAVSFEMKTARDFGPAAEFAARLVAHIEQNGMPRDTVLNVNVPDRITTDDIPYRITRQGRRIYNDSIVERLDQSTDGTFMIGTKDIAFEEDIESDFFAVTRGYISITPLHLDLTNYVSIGEIKRWRIETGSR